MEQRDVLELALCRVRDLTLKSGYSPDYALGLLHAEKAILELLIEIKTAGKENRE